MLGVKLHVTWLLPAACALYVSYSAQIAIAATQEAKVAVHNEAYGMAQAETNTIEEDDPATDNSPPLEDDMSLGEIPIVETTELDLQKTKQAIDTYVAVRETYQDSGLENYEDLQDFVDKTEDGKKFEAEVKAAGFVTVDEWNLIVTTASFAYTNELDDQTDEIKQQIEDLKQDTELAQDMKDRMIKSLEAMVPSENNKRVISELMKDPAYADKVKILEIEEE